MKPVKDKIPLNMEAIYKIPCRSERYILDKLTAWFWQEYGNTWDIQKIKPVINHQSQSTLVWPPTWLNFSLYLSLTLSYLSSCILNHEGHDLMIKFKNMEILQVCNRYHNRVVFEVTEIINQQNNFNKADRFRLSATQSPVFHN